MLCQPDNSDLLINVSNRTLSTLLQSRELSTPLHWARSCMLCQPDNSDLLINVSNRTLSTRLQSHELSKPLMGAILFAMLTDNSDLLIIVSNRTRSTHLQSRELTTPLTNTYDLVCYVNQTIPIYWSMPILKILIRMLQQKKNCSTL